MKRYLSRQSLDTAVGCAICGYFLVMSGLWLRAYDVVMAMGGVA